MADLSTLLRAVSCGSEEVALAALERLGAGPLARGRVLTEVVARSIPALVAAVDPRRPLLEAEAAGWLLGFSACLPGQDRWAPLRGVVGPWVQLRETEARPDAPLEASVRRALAAATTTLQERPSPAAAAVLRESAMAHPAARSVLFLGYRSATAALSRAILRDGMVAVGETAPPMAPDGSPWERALAGDAAAVSAFLLGAPAEARLVAQPWARVGLFTDLGLDLVSARPELRGPLVDQQVAHGWLELDGATLLATAFTGRGGPQDRDAVVDRALAAVAAPVLRRGSGGPRRTLERFGCLDVLEPGYIWRR